MTISAATWYRDSHGLFDYEEKEKLTMSNFKMKNNCKCEQLLLHLGFVSIVDYLLLTDKLLSALFHGLNFVEIFSLHIHQSIFILVVVLKRHDDSIYTEPFDEFRSATLNYKRLEEEFPEQKITASCMFKDNNYWIYHRFEIDNADDEKANPGDKLWLVMRHMGNDKDYNF